MPARSMCRYVRLITLNVTQVPQPCFIAPPQKKIYNVNNVSNCAHRRSKYELLEKNIFGWFYDLRYEWMVGFQVLNFYYPKNFGLSIYNI